MLLLGSAGRGASCRCCAPAGRLPLLLVLLPPPLPTCSGGGTAMAAAAGCRAACSCDTTSCRRLPCSRMPAQHRQGRQLRRVRLPWTQPRQSAGLAGQRRIAHGPVVSRTLRKISVRLARLQARQQHGPQRAHHAQRLLGLRAGLLQVRRRQQTASSGAARCGQGAAELPSMQAGRVGCKHAVTPTSGSHSPPAQAQRPGAGAPPRRRAQAKRACPWHRPG